MSESVNIISLGAGVQSSALSMMISNGDIQTPDGQPPVAAIFADTGDEPDEVYDYLNYIKEKSPWPVHLVKHGNSISEDFLSSLRGERTGVGNPPFFVKGPHDEHGEGGQLWRKCTTDYKVRPIMREAKRIMKAHGAVKINQLIGISLDEATRMKDSRVKYSTNHYPLVDARLSRWDCIRYMEKHNHPEPPKSACWHCPYHSNREWRKIKKDPKSWGKLLAFEKQLHQLTGEPTKANGAKIFGKVFVHHSGFPSIR